MEKLNIAELLRDCPKGMELDCTMYDNVTFEGIKDVGYINILIKTPNGIFELSKNGCYHFHPNAKCVIFPKGKTTWDGFQRPFKDGDIVSNYRVHSICIFKKEGCIKGTIDYYCGISFGGLYVKDGKNIDEHFGDISNYRLATEEEKEKLFKAIKDNGYKWNPETKTLEKVEVKKFDITTLKAFDKVLVRDADEMYWYANIYSHYLGKDKPYQFRCIGTIVKQCIPYKGNEHLLGTKNDCDEYYKTWE